MAGSPSNLVTSRCSPPDSVRVLDTNIVVWLSYSPDSIEKRLHLMKIPSVSARYKFAAEVYQLLLRFWATYQDIYT